MNIGIPTLPKPVVGRGLARSLISTQIGSIISYFEKDNRWGIYDSSGNSLATSIGGFMGFIFGDPGSTHDTEIIAESRVSNFPVERGSFASYNKVKIPKEVVVTLCITGTEGDRKKFLDSLQKAIEGTDLYSVQTPEKNYSDYTITKYKYKRSAETGLSILFVEIWLQEILQVDVTYSSAGATTSSTTNATATPTPSVSSASSAVSSGTIQPKAASDSLMSKASSAISGLF